MPPKPQQRNALTGRGGAPRKSRIASDTYAFITSPDNRSVVTSVAFFAAGVAFLHSSWSEILLPPL